MNKKIKTFVLATFFTVATASPVQVFATNNNNFSLTVRSATQRAVQFNRDLRTLAENLELSQDAFNRAENERAIQNFTVGGYLNIDAFIEAHATSMQERIDINQQRIDADILRGTLEFLVLNHFASIYAAHGELALYDQNIALIDRELEILGAMLYVGFASPLEYQMATLQRETVVHNRQSLVNAIDREHIALNRLIGASTDRRHTLVFDLAYEDFEELVVINMQGMINHQRQNHPTAQQARAITDVEQFRLNNHAAPIQMSTGEELRPTTTQEELQARIGQASRATIDARDAVERHIINQYNNIRTIEQDIQTIQIQLEDLQEQRSVLESRLQVGEILPIDIARHDFEIATLEQELQNTKIQHAISVMRFRNPTISITL